jgi:hypothetical protein
LHTVARLVITRTTEVRRFDPLRTPKRRLRAVHRDFHRN